MTCSEFRSAFTPATDDAAILAHVRTCDPCLDFAAHADPDIMFRAIGGEEMVPPGGVELFVEDVMRSVHLRQTEDHLAPRRNTLSWTRKLAVAATLVAGITGGTLVVRHESMLPAAPLSVQRASLTSHNFTTKPVIETYSSAKATIVEMPAESANVKVVMILDENLPADL
jgi:hypothetical protein